MNVDNNRLIEIEAKLDFLIELVTAGGLSSLPTPPQASRGAWASSKCCAEHLGIEPDKLYALRASGRLGACGINWRYANASRKAKRPTYQWHLEGCQKALSKSLAFK